MFRHIVLLGLLAVIFYCAIAGSARAGEGSRPHAQINMRTGPAASRERCDGWATDFLH